MSIIVDGKNKVFTIHTKNTTYQFMSDELGCLLHLYYGKKAQEQTMDYLIQVIDRGFSGNPYDALDDRTYSFDTLPLEYSGCGMGDYRNTPIEIIHHDGSAVIDLRFVDYEIRRGKYQLEGLPATYHGEESEAETLIVNLKDKFSDVYITLYYGVFYEKDSITRSVIVKNESKQPIQVKKVLSASLDFPYEDLELIHFHGKHAMERQYEKTPIIHGTQVIGSSRGTSSHHHNPFIILCDKNTTEEYGSCYGMSLVYSGNFTIEVEKDQIDQIRANIGISNKNFTYILNENESFTAPEVVLTYTDKGLGQLSRNYHELYRHNLCRGKYKLERRPILINNWEATYFDFTEKDIIRIAKTAKELGIEMFVMDDGWFGNRKDDSTALGDWFVNEEKIKGGLKNLVEQVNQIGMKFGIWFEPEMINEESNLYIEHPEWVLQYPNRKPVRSRNQLVLDMSRKDVRDYLFDSISKILDTANIEYVKWDMNRSISDYYSNELSSERQGELSHRYVLGLYELLERITTKYENILFEGCSGGGGRFDPGMLFYHPQIWCSDDTDAIERLKIQYGTSFCYPISTMGSHVSAVPNHQTGRETPFATRGIVAMSGSFGYEIDINKIADEEKEIAKKQMIEFKNYNELIHGGDYYRLSSPFEKDFTAWQFVSKDRKSSLVTIVSTHASANAKNIHVKLKGLHEDSTYLCMEKEYSGSALLFAGYAMKEFSREYEGIQLYFEEK